MTKYEIHKSLTRSVLSKDAGLMEILLYMVLLHTHEIHLKPGVVIDDIAVKDKSRALVLAALTRRHAAEVVASLWPSNTLEGTYEHWFSLLNSKTPYEDISDVPGSELAEILTKKRQLLNDDRVEAVVVA